MSCFGSVRAMLPKAEANVDDGAGILAVEPLDALVGVNGRRLPSRRRNAEARGELLRPRQAEVPHDARRERRAGGAEVAPGGAAARGGSSSSRAPGGSCRRRRFRQPSPPRRGPAGAPRP